MSLRRRIIPIILLSAVVAGAEAQTASTDSTVSESLTVLGKRLVGKLANNYFKVKYDTNYVSRPKEKWLLRLMGNQTGDYIHAKGTVENVYSKFDLHTRRNTSLSLEVNYCDIAASFSVNPDKIRGSYDDYEFNFEYHGQKISFDINYQRATSLTGDMYMENMPLVDRLGEDGLRMNVTNVAAYYTFNYRRFSFPAALYQNYYQHRSAGSWLAGLSFKGGSIRTTDALKERNPAAPDVHLTTVNVGIGGGYGYNFVFGRHAQWLLHLSAMPTVVVYKLGKLTVNDKVKRDHGLSFNMIFNERAAIVYHLTPRYNAGASVMMSNSIYDNNSVTFNQNKWIGRVFLGVRL